MTEPARDAAVPDQLAPAPAPPSMLGLNLAAAVVLVVTMFASCVAAISARDAAQSSANAVNGVSGMTAGVRPEEVEAMCRLLGAVAAKQGVDVTQVFKDATTATSCQQLTQQAQGR